MKNKIYKFTFLIFIVFLITGLSFLAFKLSKIKPVPEPKFEIFKSFEFSEDISLKSWKNKIFKGLTKYWIDNSEIGKFLHARSEKTASALYCMISYDIKDYPILSWKWHSVKFPDKSNVSKPEKKDDYALRVYVLFASGFFTNFKCVEYIWDETIKEGTMQTSPYSDKIKQIVVKSGQSKEEWTTEIRNVYQDYKDLFGQDPVSKVRAIAVMSDSEGSESSSEGYIKEIKILKSVN